MLRVSGLLLLLLVVLACVDLVCSQGDDKYALFQKEWCGKEDCYDVMGVARDANRTEIKRIYREKSLKLHPDKNPNATEEMKVEYLRLTRAHDVLSDTVARDQYDEYLRLKNTMNSPRESALLVFLLVYGALTFVVLQYQKQKYNQMRTTILSDLQVQREILDRFGIDVATEDPKQKRSTKKLKKKKSSKNNLLKETSGSGTEGSGDDDEDDVDPQLRVTDEQIGQVLNDLKKLTPGWTGEKPDIRSAAMAPLEFSQWAVERTIFHLRWQVRYTLLKKKLTDSDREYLCRKHFNYDAETWQALTPDARQQLLNRPGVWRRGQKKNQ